MPTLEQVELNPIPFKVPYQEHIAYETRRINSPSLPDFIRHLDTQWQKEELSQDWYTLGNRVGFSMRSQMELLNGFDDQSLELWLNRTQQDLLGFRLEYLTPEVIVYPYRYGKENDADGSIQLLNYRYKKDITKTASRTERNGSVVEALEEIKKFFTNPQTVDGSFAIMVSPLGLTGLTTDDGKPIVYPDSYILVFEKKEDIVEGFTIQTDFSKRECQEVVHRLTGNKLVDIASEEAYVRATAFLTPLFNRAGIKTKEDILNLLQKVRSDIAGNSAYAYKNISWEKVASDVERTDQLYELDIESDAIINDWKQFILEKQYTYMEEIPSDEKNRLLVQKALAATILRLSHIALKKQLTRPISFLKNSTYVFYEPRTIALYSHNNYGSTLTMGDVQNWMEQQPGCAGGGSSNNSPIKILTIESIVPRLGVTIGEANNGDDSCPSIKCKHCGWQANDSEAEAVAAGILKECPVCGWKPS